MAEVLVPRLREFCEVKTCSAKPGQLSRLWDMIRTLLKYRNGCQLVFIDTFSSRAFWFVVIISSLCRLFSIPYIPIMRGGDFATRLKQSPRLCNTIFLRAAISVTPSVFLSKLFLSAGYNHTVIPNFLNIEQYIFKKRTHAKPRLLWVRSFHSVYNPLLAIDVLVGLQKKFPEAVLCMVGADKDGSLERTRRYAQEKDVLASVQFKGYMRKQEWVALSEMYDVFINTTDFDNMPVSVLEAMALGLPVVSTNVGGIPYLIRDGENGLLVNKGDADGFVNSIIKLIENNKTLVSIISLARLEVEKLGWNEIKVLWKDIIEIYSRK